MLVTHSPRPDTTSGGHDARGLDRPLCPGERERDRDTDRDREREGGVFRQANRTCERQPEHDALALSTKAAKSRPGYVPDRIER